MNFLKQRQVSVILRLHLYFSRVRIKLRAGMHAPQYPTRRMGSVPILYTVWSA